MTCSNWFFGNWFYTSDDVDKVITLQRTYRLHRAKRMEHRAATIIQIYFIGYLEEKSKKMYESRKERMDYFMYY